MQQATRVGLSPPRICISIGLAIFSAKQKRKQKWQSIFNAKPTAVEVQHGSSRQAISPAALHPSEASPKSDKKCSSIFTAKLTGPDQPLEFSMALPLRPSMRSPPDQTSGWGSAWLFPSRRIPRSASFIKSFTQIRQKCSSIFNAKPAGLDRPLSFSMALPLRPPMSSPPDQISRWGSAWLFTLPLRPYHGSSPQAISPAALRASSMRSPPDQIAHWASAWLFPSRRIPRSASSIKSFTQIRQKCSSIFNAKPAGLDRPLRFSMALPLRPSMRSPPDQISRWGSAWLFTLPLRPYHGSSPQAHITRSASCIFNAKPSGPAPPLTFSMVHLISKPFLPSPTICPSRGIEALLSLNCHLVNGRKKVLLWSADFPLVTYIITLKIDLQTGNCHSYSPNPPNTHYVRKQQLSLACRLAFVIFQQVFHSDSGPAMVLINNLWPHDIMFSPLKCPKLKLGTPNMLNKEPPDFLSPTQQNSILWRAEVRLPTVLRWKVTSSHNIKYKYGRKNMCATVPMVSLCQYFGAVWKCGISPNSNLKGDNG